MRTKICTKCNREKLLDDFYKSKKGKYGRHSICKKCKEEQRRERNKKRKQEEIKHKQLQKVADLENEIWNDIEGYEGIYQISNLGRVKSLARYRKNGNFGRNVESGYMQKEKILKQKRLKANKTSNTSSYYLQVGLCKDGKLKTFSVHRLVAEAFIANTDKKPYVNHKDGNRENNIYTNLEWSTNKENQIHAIFEIKNNLNAIPVVAIDKKNKKNKIEFQSMTEGAKWLLTNNKTKDQTCLTGIIKCCKKKIPSYLGYIWRYKKEVVDSAIINKFI